MSSLTTLPNFVILDFETNGAKLPDGKLDLENQEPTEVAAIRVVDGEVTSVFNTLVRYRGEWTDHLASPLNHHAKEELHWGMPLQTVNEILWQFLNDPEHDHPIVIAYNALFDLQVYYTMLSHHGGGGAEDFAYGVQFIDPLTIARDRHPYPHKQGDMCAKYGVDTGDAHSAMDDCLALLELVKAMHREKDIMEYLNVAGYLRKYGEPLWKPDMAILKPQGNETIYHQADGSTSKQRPKPFARLVPKK
jgi:DNA polymerase-3 subunit epsilon/DNA polymerase-3 subunit alpha (Gram-positive type)